MKLIPRSLESVFMFEAVTLCKTVNNGDEVELTGTMAADGEGFRV